MINRFPLLFFSLIGLFISLSSSVYAQEKTVKGVVVADDGLPMPGVTVVVKGTGRGTITDIDGKYNLQVSLGFILEFSFIGYEDCEAVVGEGNEINMTLRKEAESLDAFEIIGYGSRKRGTHF